MKPKILHYDRSLLDRLNGIKLAVENLGLEYTGAKSIYDFGSQLPKSDLVIFNYGAFVDVGASLDFNQKFMKPVHLVLYSQLEHQLDTITSSLGQLPNVKSIDFLHKNSNQVQIEDKLYSLLNLKTNKQNCYKWFESSI